MWGKADIHLTSQQALKLNHCLLLNPFGWKEVQSSVGAGSLGIHKPSPTKWDQVQGLYGEPAMLNQQSNYRGQNYWQLTWCNYLILTINGVEIMRKLMYDLGIGKSLSKISQKPEAMNVQKKSTYLITYILIFWSTKQ